MNKKRPAEDPVGRQVRSRQGSPSAPSSNAHGNTPLPTTTSTHIAPPPVTHHATSVLAPVTSAGLSSSPGAPTVPISSQSSSSAAPNVSRPLENLTSSPSTPPVVGSKHKISTGFKKVFGKIDKGAKVLGGISLGMGELLESLNVIENEVKNREEYETLRSELELLWGTLNDQFSESSLQMTASIENLLNGIQKEIDDVKKKCDRNRIRRYAEATGDGEDILNCYRRVQGLLSQLSINANLEMWTIVDIQLAESRLRAMKISEAARYNSSESTGLLRGKCTPETRRQVIGGLHTWIDNPDALNVYWLNGMAGTGKTTIAYSFCSEREEMHSLGASFFCSRSSPSCNDATMIVPTIAYQLALFSYPFRSVLCGLLGKELDICNRDVTTQFQHMIIDSLRKTGDSVPQNTVVVIDALDECSNQRDVGLFLEALLSHASQLPIKFFILSRAEGATHPQMMLNPAIRSVFYLHEVEESFVREDIELYVRSELAPINPTPEQISQLVNQAGRLFIYAATVIRYVKRDEFDDYSLDRLDSLLQRDENNDDIDDLYTRILTSAFNRPRLSKQEQLDMLEVLHTVICAKEPLTVDALGALLRPKRPKVVRTALLPFSSVLHVSQVNDLVAVFHASFPDYLLSQQRAGRFYCDMRQQNGQLANLCINRIRSVNPPFNICALESSYLLDSEVANLEERVAKSVPFELFYACRHWPSHVEMGDEPEKMKTLVFELLTSHLLLWMEVMNLKKCMNIGARLFSHVQTWFQNHSCDNTLLDLARDANNFITVFAGSPASLSTPHIYVSALALWSPSRPVSVHYRKHLRGLVEANGNAALSGNSPLIARWSADDVTDLAISPDGIHLATSHYFTISIRDSYTGKEVLELVHEDENFGLLSSAYSPDGTRFVSGSENSMIYVWDTRTGQIAIGPLEGHTEQVNTVTYSTDGSHIISGSADKTIRVWDSSAGLVIYELKGHAGPVYSVACSPDNTAIASVGADDTLFVWDLQIGHMTYSSPIHKSGVRSVVYSPDGKHIACVVNSTIDIRDAHTGQKQLGQREWDAVSIKSIAYSPDGRRICSCDQRGDTYIWDVHTGEKVAGPFQGDPESYKSSAMTSLTAYSADGARIISAFHWEWEEGAISIWDALPAEGRNLQTPKDIGELHAISFSPDGTQIVSGSEDGTVCVRDAYSYQPIFSAVREHKKPVVSVTYSSNGSHIFSISEDAIFTWDARTGQILRVTQLDISSSYGARITYFPSGSGLPLIASSTGPNIHVWDAHSGQLVLEMGEDGLRAGPIAMACSPDGGYIASAYGDLNAIVLWDVSSGQSAGVLQGPSVSGVRALAYSPDGRHIASGSNDGTVCIWNVFTRTAELGPIEGHTSHVIAVAYSPDGAHVASSSDGTMCVWSAHTGERIAERLCISTWIESITYSPDSTRIVVTLDNTILVWRPDPPFLGAEHTRDLDKDGWIVNSLSQRLMYVPVGLRDGPIVMMGKGEFTSTSNLLILNFDSACLGDSWTDIYVAS